MKKLTILLVLASALAQAQPPPEEIAPEQAAWDAREMPPPREGPPPEGPGPGPGDQDGERPPLQRFLEILRQQNPQEFDRLKSLRESDPAAFRKELHERLQQERDKRGLQGGPGAGLREQMGRRMMEGGPGPDGMNVRSPEIDRLEKATHDLAQSYRKATGDAEKARLQGELKQTLEQAFDLREQLRRERFEQTEARLRKVREMMEQRQAQRDAIIDRRLKELTEGEKLAW
jgi:hypothetical protein